MTVVPVVKPLLAVSSLTAKGCRVNLAGPEDSFLILPDKTKEKLHIHNDVYVLPLYLNIKTTGGVDHDGKQLFKDLEAVFHWQVAAP